MFGFKKKLDLYVEIDDNWTFKASGHEDTVIALFAGWLGELGASHEETPKREKLPVGFTSSKSTVTELVTAEETLGEDGEGN